jgi:predicted DCC family thiol-disulfide oxidoreductase YuxK
MISLISEMTDTKGRHAVRGWVCFDRDCPVCVSLARRFRLPLEKRGFGLAVLQDPRVQTLLALPPQELLREMRVATGDGEIYGGADAVVFLARQIWWAWPLFALAKLPAPRAFSMPVTAGLPIAGLARLRRAPFPERAAGTICSGT